VLSDAVSGLRRIEKVIPRSSGQAEEWSRQLCRVFRLKDAAPISQRRPTIMVAVSRHVGALASEVVIPFFKGFPKVGSRHSIGGLQLLQTDVERYAYAITHPPS